MTLEQRSEQLSRELSALLKISVDYLFDSSAEGEDPLWAYFKQLIKEKTAQLNEINAKMRSPVYRFWRSCHDCRIILWFMPPLCYLASALNSAARISSGVLLFFLGLLSLVLAVWATARPFDV